MIKPILLLLVAAAGLALLNQTNSVQTPLRLDERWLCPSLWYECQGAVGFRETPKTYGRICVPFWHTRRNCSQDLTAKQIAKHCKQEIRKDHRALRFTGAVSSKLQCNISRVNGSSYWSIFSEDELP